MSVPSPNITMKPEPRPSLLHRIPDATLRLALTLSVLLTLHIWVWTTAMVTAVLAWRLLHDHFPDRPDELALLLTNLAGSPPLACEPSDGRETVTRRLFLALGAMWAENGNLFAMLCPDWSTST